MGAKFEKVMAEFKAGTLKTVHGKKVTSRRQAKAIAAKMDARERAQAKPRKAQPVRTRSHFLRTG